jgi:succinate dehydrogenase / fumarate reductase cytochrome b subunit
MRGYSAAENEQRLSRLALLWRASIGGKFVMAITGLLLLLFVIVHLTANLTVFNGPDGINAYSQWLHDLGGLLWVARIVLLGIFILHVATAIRLELENREARPERYRFHAVVQATLASRTMIWTGALVGVYVVYHLLHFTTHTIDTGRMGLVDANGNIDVYSMVISGFSRPLIALSYIVANLILGVHLYHAIDSMFQTLGWDHPTFKPIARVLAIGLPVLIALGYLLIPLSIWLGLVQ